MTTIITIENTDTGEFFFTTDHCQPHNLGEGWVSVTNYRTTREVVKRVIETPSAGWLDMKEIPNPQPEYQA